MEQFGNLEITTKSNDVIRLKSFNKVESSMRNLRSLCMCVFR